MVDLPEEGDDEQMEKFEEYIQKYDVLNSLNGAFTNVWLVILCTPNTHDLCGGEGTQHIEGALGTLLQRVSGDGPQPRGRTTQGGVALFCERLRECHARSAHAVRTQCEVLNVGQYSDPTFGPF